MRSDSTSRRVCWIIVSSTPRVSHSEGRLHRPGTDHKELGGLLALPTLLRSPRWGRPGLVSRTMDELKVAAQIESVRQLFAQTKGHKLSEASTKAAFVDPLLTALGWPMQNPFQVVREYKVYDSTLLDYALFDQEDQKPAIFVEAKALGKTLDDHSFIAQTVNYANNEGVRWCVLTNGTKYRIYRTVEPVPMERKMLQEIDLLDEDRPPQELATAMRALSRDFICSGQLEEWGQSVFNDVKVREALASLYTEPTQGFIAAIRKAMPPEANVGKQDVVVSLKRLGTHLAVPKATLPAAQATVEVEPSPGPWTLDHHLAGKPTQVRDLYEKLDEQVMGLGDDVRRTFSKFYINYSVKTSFSTVQVGRSLIKIYMSVPLETLGDLDSTVFRDVSHIGHYGMGDLEARYSEAGQLDHIMPVLKLAYEHNH